MKTSKYRARKVKDADGRVFDSRKEYKRWLELKEYERLGTITELKRQWKFELIPSQRRDGKVAERAVNYFADFVYKVDGVTVVEDVKGFKTPEYIIKRKLMLYVHNIKIKEV